MNNSSGYIITVELIAVFLLVLANGFFVAAEFALVAVRRSRVDQLVAEGRPLAIDLRRAVTHLDSYLAATQLGVTMSSLGLGWLGEPAIAHLIEPTLERVLPENIATVGAHTLSIVIAFTIITALHIVLGELAPKSLALQRPEITSLWIIKPLDFYLSIFRPAVHVLNNLGNLVLSLLGLQSGSGEELVHSPDEIRLLVSASRQAGLLGEAEEDVVERVFRLGNQRINALMTPRIDVTWLDIEDSIPQLQDTIMTSVYSHFPVCQGTVDDLLGFVTAKEVLAASIKDAPLTLAKLVNLLDPPLYVPEVMTAFNGLEVFKQSGRHVAAVVDEYGAMQGLVTLNDILEAIVGDIRTGDEPAEPQAVPSEDGSWLLDGLLPIEEFQDIFGIRELPEEEESLYQTIGGLVLTHLGRVPAASESFEWHHLNFKVISMNRNRVDKVLVTPVKPGDSKGNS
ncbi:MAG TPA: hemolysin family protein [Coleofasciculaceae cyanobacterium]